LSARFHMQLAEIEKQGLMLEQRVLWLGSGLTAIVVVVALTSDFIFAVGMGTALGTLYLYISVLILRRCAIALMSSPPRPVAAVVALLAKGALFAIFVYGVASAADPVLAGALGALLLVIPAAVLTFKAGEMGARR